MLIRFSLSWKEQSNHVRLLTSFILWDLSRRVFLLVQRLHDKVTQFISEYHANSSLCTLRAVAAPIARFTFTFACLNWIPILSLTIKRTIILFLYALIKHDTKTICCEHVYDLASSKMNRYSFYVSFVEAISKSILYLYIRYLPSIFLLSFLPFAQEVLSKPQYTHEVIIANESVSVLLGICVCL